VTAVYRKKFVIHVERVTKDKANSASWGMLFSNNNTTTFFLLVHESSPPPLPLYLFSPSAGKTSNVGIHPSNVEITKLGRMDTSRVAMLKRKGVKGGKAVAEYD
jgi:hypothetical protein